MRLTRSLQPASARAWPRQQQLLQNLLGQRRLSAQSIRFLYQQHSPRAAGASSAASAASRVLAGRRVADRRWETSTTGDDNSGHIAAEPGEGLLFLDNVFPLRIGNLLAWRPWRASNDFNDQEVANLQKKFAEKPAPSSSSKTISKTAPKATPSAAASSPPPTSGIFVSLASAADPVGLVRRAIPADLGITVTEIVPRLKDGGVFVKFRHPAGMTLDAVEAQLTKTLAAHPVRPWFNPLWGCMRAGLVRGVPWLEDLASRIPSSRVCVEFCAPPTAASGTGGIGDATGSASLELSQETIYSLFRRYGKIAEITSQPFDSKILPRYATVDFLRMRDAVMARSCLHGYVVNGTTRLRMSYEKRTGAGRHLWDWLTSHPRIVIPILAALLATLTVAVFDPIRTFFIRTHVQHSFALRDSQLWKWFERRTLALLSFARKSYDSATDSMGMGAGERDKLKDGPAHRDALLNHRQDLIESLHTWFLETTGTFIVVQGPRGSGKNELVVKQALHGRRDVLVVDCKPIVEARGESATIKTIATAIGYRPVFSWANNLSSLIDLAVQGTTGVKTGFSETLDEQLTKILQTATVALRQVGLDGRHKGDVVDAQLNDDAYLEAHPERRPVIVLDNFGHRNEDATGPVYDKLAEWAATLVQANIAHVVFLTSDTSYPKALIKAMPDRVFRQIALGDLSPDVAMKYVLSHLAEQEVDEPEDEEPEAVTEGAVTEGAAASPGVSDAAASDASAAATTPSATSVVTAIIDAKKAKEAKEKADLAEKKAAEQSSSIIQKVSMPFQKAKDAVASVTAAANKPSAGAAAPATHADKSTAVDPSSLNTAAAKAALALEGGPAAATSASSPLPKAQQEIISELDSCIGVLGGRLTDLESLVRRLKSGQTPKRAVSEIVELSASEIIKMFLLSQPGSSSNSNNQSSTGSRSWTPEQAWHLVREIAAHDGSVGYNDVLLSETFAPSGAASEASGIAAIDALAAAELVTVRAHRGRPHLIKPGSPVYLAAFQFLGSDRALAARLDRCVLAERAALEAKTVAKVEQELAVLGTLWRQPAQTTDRIMYLLNKLQASQAKIAAYEAEMAKLKKIMSEKA